MVTQEGDFHVEVGWVSFQRAGKTFAESESFFQCPSLIEKVPENPRLRSPLDHLDNTYLLTSVKRNRRELWKEHQLWLQADGSSNSGCPLSELLGPANFLP